MSHVENSRLVEFSFGAENLFKLFNMFITSTYELTFEYFVLTCTKLGKKMLRPPYSWNVLGVDLFKCVKFMVLSLNGVWNSTGASSSIAFFVALIFLG